MSKGTLMYCPNCGDYQKCESIYSWGREKEQRREFASHRDLNYFRRERRCSECDSQFLTAEVPEEKVEELVRLRDLFSSLKAEIDLDHSPTDKISAMLLGVSKVAEKLERLNAHWE